MINIHSRLIIRLYIFQFSTKILKNNMKFEKKIHYLGELVGTKLGIDAQHQRFILKTSPAISLKIVVQTDAQNQFRNAASLKDLSNNI